METEADDRKQALPGAGVLEPPPSRTRTPAVRGVSSTRRPSGKRRRGLGLRIAEKPVRKPIVTTGVLGPVLLTAVLHTVILVSYVAAYRGDLSALVCVDAGRIERWPFEAIHVGFAKGGYDGQLYYILARQPWSRYSQEDLGVPAYRHAHILYPALAWLCSGGHPVLLLWVMPAINLAALSGLAWVGALLARHYRRSPWWGCLLPLLLNAGMPALRNLTDPLATATICAVLAAYLLKWPVWQMALWAVTAALSREQNVGIILLVLGDAVLKRRWRRSRALAVALLPWLGWIVTLRVWYAEWPMGSGLLGVPLSGIWYILTHLTGHYGRPALLNIVGMLLLSGQMCLSGILLVRARRLTAGITLAGVILALLGAPPLYHNGWGYVRVFLWMPLGIWLWSIQSGRRWPILLLLPGVFWLVLATVQPWIE